MLRLFGELTNQQETLEHQLLYFLLRQKEEALGQFITMYHPDCDKDHTQACSSPLRCGSVARAWTRTAVPTADRADRPSYFGRAPAIGARQVQPWQQRAHLKSAYLVLFGGSMGFEGVLAAQGDRYVVRTAPLPRAACRPDALAQIDSRAGRARFSRASDATHATRHTRRTAGTHSHSPRLRRSAPPAPCPPRNPWSRADRSAQSRRSGGWTCRRWWGCSRAS